MKDKAQTENVFRHFHAISTAATAQMLESQMVKEDSNGVWDSPRQREPAWQSAAKAVAYIRAFSKTPTSMELARGRLPPTYILVLVECGSESCLVDKWIQCNGSAHTTQGQRLHENSVPAHPQCMDPDMDTQSPEKMNPFELLILIKWKRWSLVTAWTEHTSDLFN